MSGYQSNGLRYIVESSDDLTTWDVDPVNFAELESTVDNGDGTETVTIRMNEEMDSGSGAERQFIRLRVERD